MDNNITKERINYCRVLVRSTGGQVLIVKLFDVTNYYFITDFRPKSLNNAYHEVIHGINVTTVIENFNTHFTGQTISSDRFEGLIMDMSTESFKFGSDDFLWITDVK